MFAWVKAIGRYLSQWFMPEYQLAAEPGAEQRGIDWIAAVPFLLLHVACLGVIWVGWSPFAVWFAVFFYAIRMFGITAFFHRYFSHHAFQANRFFAFLFAFLGCSAAQKGPLWWAAVHRHHHRYADLPEDVHSPLQRGFWWSHIGWILARQNKRTRIEYLKDLLRYPELVLLDKLALAVPFLVGGGIYLLGDLLRRTRPDLGTDGAQLLVWGFFISTVACSHATFSINSVDHMLGGRRYDLPDTSRNNLLMAVLTLGEGWHNNHHHYPITAKAGFYWWEIDVTYYLLVLLSWLRIVRNLRPLPENTRGSNRLVRT